MEASDARKLKTLEGREPKLEKLLAESMLAVAMLREALGMNVWPARPAQGSGAF